MKELTGTTGHIFNEPLLWEKGSTGRTGFSLPRRDVDAVAVDKEVAGNGPDFPDLSELDVVRHFTRLSQWNFGVDSGMYPLGSCTMKYNPKTNERQAALPGFAGAHPLLPAPLSQGALKLLFDLEQ
jgi:glycine dehydrogenase subunit 2